MEKVCGFKSKDGYIYSTEKEATYSNIKIDLDKLENNLRKRMLGLTTYRTGNAWIATDYLDAEDTVLQEISATCNMILDYRKQLEELKQVITSKPKSKGFFNKLFK